jgi:cob(I)alamin adenosyltransferase
MVMSTSSTRRSVWRAPLSQVPPFDPSSSRSNVTSLPSGVTLRRPTLKKVRAALAKAELGDDRVRAMEAAIDAADTELPPLRAFVLPGGSPGAAALHVARTVCRRAERSVVGLARNAEVPTLFIVYLNRLSDLLFTLARLANHREGRHDVTW